MIPLLRATFSPFAPIPYPSESGKSRSSEKPNCWRIQNIPEGWSKGSLLDHLRAHHPSLQSLEEHWLSLYPAYSGKTGTALLNIEAPLEFFQGFDTDRTHPITIVHLSATGERIEVDLTVDCHFHGLTPLNIPEGDNIIDVVAVTGLSGHAFGSWRNRENYRMWLKDFLPKDIPRNLRILTYGYNSSLIKPGKRGLLEYRRTFIQNLANARNTLVDRSRPLIFVGHSLGCILITQALLQSQSNPDDKHVLDSTHAVFFFGAPHAGLKVDSLVAMVDDLTSSNRESTRLKLLEQLREDSDFLEDQRERLIHIWAGMRIISFYELRETPTVKRGASGDWERRGDAVQMIRNISALLYLQQEHRFAIDEDHTNMVKFMTPTDKNYQTVLLHMNWRQVKMRSFGIMSILWRHEHQDSPDAQGAPDAMVAVLLMGTIGSNMLIRNEYIAQKKFEEMLQRSKALNDFLDTLKAFSCQAYRDDLFDQRHPETCRWFFDCEEYKDWTRQKSSSLLWISGDPGSGKSVLLSYVTKKLSSSHSRPLVAYFFCDDKRKEQNTAIAILRSLLFQVLTLAPALYKHIPREYLPDFNSAWSFGSLWQVFENIITSNNDREIVCVVDALDECEKDTRDRFLEDLIKLFGRSPDDTNKGLRMIIASRPELPSTRELPTSINIALEKRNFGDIGQFIDFKVARLVRRKNLPSDLKFSIRDALVSGANGMFLWVSLTLYRLEHSSGTSANSLREQLKELPKDIPAIYAKILQEIESESREKAKRILEWVNSANRPLQVGELKIIIALQPSHVSIAVMQDNIENNPSHFFSAIFGPLLKIDRDDTVRFVHQTVKDFLINLELMKKFDSNIASYSPGPGHELGVVSAFHISYGESHLHLAIDCLNFLSSEEFGEEPPQDILEYYSRIKDYPFLYYSAMQWPVHVEETDRKNDKGLFEAFLRLARADTKMNSAYQIYYDHSSHGRDLVSMLNERIVFKSTPPLQICVLFGFTELIKALLDEGFDINEQGGVNGSALSAAVFNRKEDIAKLLLNEQKTENVLITDSMVEYVAKWFNDPEVLELLLSKGGRVTETAMIKAASSWDGLKPLEYLLSKGGLVTEAVLMGAAAGSNNPCGTLRILLRNGGVMTEAVMVKAAKRTKIDVELLDLMLNNNTIQITEAILASAARNIYSPIELVNLLLDRGGRVTEAVMVAAAENWTNTKELLEVMLSKGGQVTAEVLIVVAGNENGAQALELLLAKDISIPVSEAMLLQAVKLQVTTTAQVQLLLSRGGRVTEAVMIAAVANCAQPRLLKILLGRGGEVTEEVLLAAIGNLGHKSLEVIISKGIQVTEGLMVAATQTMRAKKLLELLTSAGGQVTNTVMVNAARSQYEDEGMMELLLSKGGQVTEEVVVAAAGNSVNGHDILELLLGIEPTIAVTERMLIEAAMGKSEGRSLEILLMRAHDNLITEAVLVAVVSKFYSKIHLELLLGGDYLHGQVTENVLVAAAAGYLVDEKGALEFLLSTDNTLYLTEEVLVVAAGNPMGKEILSSVLGKGHNIFVTEAILVAAASNKITNGVLDLLLGADDTIPITENILVAATGSPYGSSFVEPLLRRGGKVTESVMISAAGNVKRSRELLETLLKNSSSTTPITEAILVAAAGNRQGKETLEYLLSTSDNIIITEAVMVAAAGTEESLEFLLSMEPVIPITQEVLLAAAASGYRYDNVQRILSKDINIQVTEEVLLVGAASCPKEAFTALLSRAKYTVPITEAILVQAARNRDASEIIELLFNTSNSLSVTEAVLEAVASNVFFSRPLEYLFSRADPPPEITEAILLKVAANGGGMYALKSLRNLRGPISITEVTLVCAAWCAPDFYNLQYLLERVNTISITETLMVAAALNPTGKPNLTLLLSLGGRITERVMTAAAWNPNTECLEFLWSKGGQITEKVVMGAVMSPAGEKGIKFLQGRSSQANKPVPNAADVGLKESIDFLLGSVGHVTKMALLRVATYHQEDGPIGLAFRTAASETKIAILGAVVVDNEPQHPYYYKDTPGLQALQFPGGDTSVTPGEIEETLVGTESQVNKHVPVALDRSKQLNVQNIASEMLSTQGLMESSHGSRVTNTKTSNINSQTRLVIVEASIFFCDLLIVGGLLYGATLYLIQAVNTREDFASFWPQL